MGPAFSPKETQHIDNETNRYGDAQQQYQQALQNLSNLMQNIAAKTMPNPSAVKASQGPQIKNGGQNQLQVPACILYHYACNK